ASLNFVIDSDTVKSTSIPFPVCNKEPSLVSTEAIPFDFWRGEELHLRRPVHDAKLFREFPAASEHVWAAWPFRPLLSKFWQSAIRVHEECTRSSLEGSDEGVPPTLMWFLTVARREIEGQWGCDTYQPHLLSFDRRHLVAHVLADLPRFH